MSDDNKMDMIYASGKSYGKSMEQAMQLAAKAKELNASIVNIEVKSEETFRLRDENAQLKAQVEQLKGGMNFNYEKNQELVTDNEKLRSLLTRALGVLWKLDLGNDTPEQVEIRETLAEIEKEWRGTNGRI